jgi:hypothetical protein
MKDTADQVRVEGTEETVYEYFLSQGWTDGLPVIPPTVERVEAFLAQAKFPPGEVIGVIPPQWAELSVEKLAVNAVMAGCKPEYMPVLVAAVKGMCDPAFNLYGVQATTNPVGPMLAVNGPIANEIGLKADTGALGPGWRANVTIGRALRLVLINVGGGIPGDMDRATQGMPGKLFFSKCPTRVDRLVPRGSVRLARLPCQRQSPMPWRMRSESESKICRLPQKKFFAPSRFIFNLLVDIGQALPAGEIGMLRSVFASY